MVKYMRLPTIGENIFGSHGFLKLGRSFTFLSRGLKVCHPELEEHTQHAMSLADQYSFRGADHFYPKEVMKVLQVLHIEQCNKLEFYVPDIM